MPESSKGNDLERLEDRLLARFAEMRDDLKELRTDLQTHREQINHRLNESVQQAKEDLFQAVSQTKKNVEHALTPVIAEQREADKRIRRVEGQVKYWAGGIAVLAAVAGAILHKLFG